MNLTDHAGSGSRTASPRSTAWRSTTKIGGAGEPVFLLHGVPETMSCSRHVVPLLTPHYTVIAVDNRGSGGSQRPLTGYDTATMAGDVAELATHLGFDQFRVVGEDGAAIAYAVAAFHRPRVRQLVFQEAACRDWAERARAAAGRAGTAVLDVVRQTPDAGPQRAGRGDRRVVHSAEQPGGTRAILEMYRARQTDAEQNRPHYADPIGAPSEAASRRASRSPKSLIQAAAGGSRPASASLVLSRRPGTSSCRSQVSSNRSCS